MARLIGAGHRVLVTGDVDEGELVAFVAGAGACPVVGVALADLASIIGAADVMVCGNTGPAHLAAAMATPVVEIYAPTVPAERWAPWQVPHVLLGDSDIACSGCRQRVCPIEGQPCLAAVSDADVLDAIEAVRHGAATVAGVPA